MSRSFTNDIERDLLRPNSGGAWLWLCEITVANQPTKRFTDNLEDIEYNSQTFEKMAMTVGRQEFSSDEQLPQIVLQVSNVRREIEQIVNDTEGLSGGSVMLVKVNDKYLNSQVTALEADYDVIMAESDEDWVTITLGVPNLLTQRFPLREYSSKLCPWSTPTLFKGPRCGYSGGDATCTGTLSDCRTKGNAARWGGEIGLDPSLMQT